MALWMWALLIRQKLVFFLAISTLYESWTTNINHFQTNIALFVPVSFHFVSYVLTSHMYIIGHMVKSIAFLFCFWLRFNFMSQPKRNMKHFSVSHDDNCFNWFRRKCFCVMLAKSSHTISMCADDTFIEGKKKLCHTFSWVSYRFEVISIDTKYQLKIVYR